MRLDDLDPTTHAEDQGTGGGGFGMGGGGGGLGGLLFGLLPLLLGRRLGCGTLLLIAVVGFFLFSSGMLNFSGPTTAPTEAGQSSGANVPCDTAEELLACRVMKSTEDTWGKVFQQAGQQYRPAEIHFYSHEGQSGCGEAQSAMGPFYCPSDQGVYLDTDFFRQMREQLGGGGDFAYAYVVAHEVGHHIQNLTGVADRVRQLQSRSSEAQGNALQVRMELQADCLAGVWAGLNADRIEPGDVEEGMRTANAIGDDKLIAASGQRPVESMFTHGTSEQRMQALQRGIQGKNPNVCSAYFDGIL